MTVFSGKRKNSEMAQRIMTPVYVAVFLFFIDYGVVEKEGTEWAWGEGGHGHARTDTAGQAGGGGAGDAAGAVGAGCSRHFAAGTLVLAAAGHCALGGGRAGRKRDAAAIGRAEKRGVGGEMEICCDTE
jgi:hypothetical protein